MEQNYATNPKFNLGNVDPLSYEHNEKLIRNIAWKCFGRAEAAHLGMDFDDVVQEVTVSWWKARESFDDSAGVNFSTYFVRSAYNNFNKLMARECNYRVGLGLVSMDSMLSEDTDGMLHEIMPADTPTPEDVRMWADRLSWVLSRLSDRARHAVSLIVDPPELLAHELQCARAKAELSREMGVNARAATDLTYRLVVDYMIKVYGAPKSTYSQLIRELGNLKAKLIELDGD